jgi:NADH-quinone oxidoreductase subunit E
MLSDEVRAEIEAELRDCPERRAGCVEALKIVQKHHRWVSDEHFADVALMLGMSADDLDGVATFYPFIFRRPVGRHVILVCDSIVCWTMGYEGVSKAIGDKLGISFGETSADDRFTLLPSSCIGECNHAPALIVDNDVYRDVTPERVDAILERYA